MRTLIDCHVHTDRCGHACGSAADYVQAAARGGVSWLVMTEHLALPQGWDPHGTYSMSRSEIAEYVSEVTAAAESTQGVEVVIGAESDWIPSCLEEGQQIRREARSAGVSVILGSVHFIDSWAFDDPACIAEWDTKRVDAVWEDYFRLWCDAARSNEFDVMAHPDLVKKFGHRPHSDVRDLYVEAARSAREADVLIEISTAGLRKPVAEIYPGPDLLTAFFDAGVNVTVGSDAHDPAEVGYRLDAGYAAARKAGYRSVRVPLGPGTTRTVEI